MSGESAVARESAHARCGEKGFKMERPVNKAPNKGRAGNGTSGVAEERRSGRDGSRESGASGSGVRTLMVVISACFGA